MDSSPRCLKKEKRFLKLDCQGIAFDALTTDVLSIVELGSGKKKFTCTLNKKGGLVENAEKENIQRKNRKTSKSRT